MHYYCFPDCKTISRSP